MKGHTIEEQIRARRLLGKLEVEKPLGDDQRAIEQKFCYGKGLIFCLCYLDYIYAEDLEAFYGCYDDYLETGKTKDFIAFLNKAKANVH